MIKASLPCCCIVEMLWVLSGRSSAKKLIPYFPLVYSRTVSAKLRFLHTFFLPKRERKYQRKRFRAATPCPCPTRPVVNFRGYADAHPPKAFYYLITFPKESVPFIQPCLPTKMQHISREHPLLPPKARRRNGSRISCRSGSHPL